MPEKTKSPGWGGLWFITVAGGFLIAWQLHGPTAPQPGPDVPGMPLASVNYIYIDSESGRENLTPVTLRVHPADEEQQATLISKLSGCYVFFKNVIPMSPEDSALLYTVKPYTDKENIITDKELKPGVVQEVRVLLERSFQRLRTAGQFEIVPKGPPKEVPMGQDFSVELGIQGVEPQRVVKIESDHGVVAPDRPKTKWVWTGRVNKPGETVISLWGRDSRGSGAKSSAPRVSFTVVARPPMLMQRAPFGAYADEFFDMNVGVFGLENVSEYAWKINIDDKTIAEGSGTKVRHLIPPDALGRQMTVVASYKGKPFTVASDSLAKSISESVFTYAVKAPTDHIDVGFDDGGEYAMGHTFEFFTQRCGRCIAQNAKIIDQREISIIAEIDGKDVLDDFTFSPQRDGTIVKFRLKAKLPKAGAEAFIRLRAGSASKELRVTLMPN